MKINKEKITREFCKGKILLFFPATEDEANFIYQKISELGFAPRGTHPGEPDKCVAEGMVLKNSKLSHFIPEEDSSGFVCAISQFDENYLSPDQAFIMEQFNKLATRLDARIDEIAQAVAGIQKELSPAKLDKSPLKTGPGS